jgi:hypothetical protein
MPKSPAETTTFHLIVPVTAEQEAPEPKRARPADRGGEEHGLREVAEFLGLKEVKAPDFKTQLERALKELNVILDVTSSATFPIPKMEFESMEVGLAISAKGSIGIVTAGVEASLRLKFKKS